MKCLVIHGSPRRGNTWDVLNIVKEEMQKNGDFEFEIIELAKEKIPMCIGCFNCIEKGENKCPHNSYIEPIVKKMEEADAFIFYNSSLFNAGIRNIKEFYRSYVL